jgi:choline kinase
MTDDCPKCLVEVGGKSMLVRQLEMLSELGIRDTVIVTGYRRSDVERVAAGFEGIRLVHNPFWSLTNVIGSAWFGLRAISDSMVYLHGDTLVERPIMEALLAKRAPMLLPYDGHPCADEEMKVRLEGGRLVEINKTMDPAVAEGEFLGICTIDGGFLEQVKEAVDAELAAQRFQGFFEVAIQRLVDEGRGPVELIDISGHFWREIDTPEDLAAARAHFSA